MNKAIEQGPLSPSPFPIVGIGGSAGGLEAFQEVLRTLSPRTGMAFVFVLHSDPKHASALPQILSKCNEMPVFEVELAIRE